jgi:shikimate kinase
VVIRKRIIAYNEPVRLRHIYLVGFMGAGKSTVGRELSLKLKLPFIDLDSEIQKAEGLTVQEIFSRLGEPHFRELERAHLKRLSGMPEAIIALGGGAYVDPENRRLIEDTGGVSVWLNASLASIRKRVRPDGTRPLMSDPERARTLYFERLPVYKLAGIHVLTDNRLPDDIAEEIVQKVKAL